jgi:hypothetical protein
VEPFLRRTVVKAAAWAESADRGRDLAQALFGQVPSTAGMARQYRGVRTEGAGPRVAPPFDRALGLAGRDPAWTPDRPRG